MIAETPILIREIRLTQQTSSNGQQATKTKFVYLFDEVEEAETHVGGPWDGVRALLGGKGANLADMTRLDIPVPPGFTVTTAACNAYLEAGEKFPEGMWEQELEAVQAIEQQTGKRFGDPHNPPLVSCRSGAKFLHAWHDGYHPQHRPER